MNSEQLATEVAACLEMDKTRLKQFVELHPDPTVEVLEATAERPVTDEQREVVREWLEQFGDPVERPDLGGDIEGLMW